MEPRRLTPEQLVELNGLIDELYDTTAKLRTIDPENRDEWVKERHRQADLDAKIEALWPARAEPL